MAESPWVPDVNILESQLLSDNWYVLRKLRFSLRHRNGELHTHEREVYDRGNGAAILLYNSRRQTLILTRQFRMPTWVNGNPSGMLLEVCAGLLDADDPEQAVRREVSEETGFSLGSVVKVFEAYMSPGSVTEILHFFVAEYEPEQRMQDGGGVDGEDIEVVELHVDQAVAALQRGAIRDAKTIMLLQYALLHGLLGPTPLTERPSASTVA